MSKLAQDSLAEPLIADGELSERLSVDGKEEEVVLDEDTEANLNWNRGEKQPSTCNDGLWSILFLVQIVVIATIAIAWGMNMPDTWPSTIISNTDDDSSTSNAHVFGGLSILTLLAAVGACGVASLALVVATHFAAQLIQASIIFNILLSVAFSVTCFTQDAVEMGAFGLFACFLGILYAWSIWPMIPWAASNLVTAVTAIRTNVGLTLIGLGMVLLTSTFTLLWLLAFFGTAMHSYTCDDGTSTNCSSHMNGFVVALFLLSLYWTTEVIKELWGHGGLLPEEASSTCSPAVKDSIGRACTSSFGSICLGSLLVALIQLLHSMVRSARQQNGGVLACLLECLVAIIQSLLQYFNKWAFVYIGLYGYTYWEAGPKVMELFHQRGWTTILNDQLIYRVLRWMSLVMGLLSGVFVVGVVKMYPSFLQGVDPDSHATIAFVLGLAIGSLLSNILLSIIASAVDTVLVCFAEAPLEFRHAYPELSQGMEQAWRKTFPSEYRIVADSSLV